MRKINYNCKYNEAGIYKIVCTANNKVYVGSSIRIGVRASQHITSLLSNKHRNPHLQKAYNKYGVDCFYFELLELCDSNIILAREQYYMDLYKCSDRNFGYNIRIVAENSRGLKASKEHREKLSQSLKQAYKDGRRSRYNVNLMKSAWKPVAEYYNGIQTNTYVSAAETARVHNLPYDILYKVAAGLVKKIKKMPGYSFKFIDNKKKDV